MIEPGAMFPVLVAADLDGLNEFYISNFGFQAVFYDTDFYLHLLQPNSGIQLGFLSPDHASQPEFLHAQAGRDGMVITFEVADVKEALDTASRAGLEMVMHYKEEAWGQKHFMVRDPAGFVIDLVEQEQ